MDMVWLYAALGGVSVGAIAAWLAAGSRMAALAAENRGLAGASAEAKTARAELENLKGKLDAAERDRAELVEGRKRIFDLGRENASLRTDLDKTQSAHAEQVRQLTELRREMQEQFELIAAKALEASATGFLRQANQVFENQKTATSAELDKRAKAIADLLLPLNKSLDSYDVALKEIEKNRVASFASLSDAVRAVATQQGEVKTVTASLVNALRASPKTRGRWAEETLRRVMELSGMVEHCDFETEKHFRGEDSSLRPDVVIQVAGGRTIIVDAKAPTAAYLEATEALTEEERESCLKRHAAQFRERLSNLASKSYWEKIEGSPDCVVMFVPGDNFVSAAFERDRDLFEDGIRSRVLICTPTTFIALSKAISYGWGQERLAANAVAIAKLGKELYMRLSTLGEHVSDLGRHINNAAKKYNAMVGSLESNVLPQARRFSELGVEGAAKPIELMPVDTVVRFPQANRDLLIANAE